MCSSRFFTCEFHVHLFGMLMLLHYAVEVQSASDYHPLDPLSQQEIRDAAVLTKTQVKNPELIKFHAIWLKEPPKSMVAKYFWNDSAPPSNIDRIVNVWVMYEKLPYSAEINLSQKTVVKWEPFPTGFWPMITEVDCRKLEQVIRSDARIVKRCASLGFANMSLVYSEPWSYGYSDDEPDKKDRKLVRAYLWGAKFEDDNMYAHPFPFAVVFDMNTFDIVELQELSLNDNSQPKPVKNDQFDFQVPQTSINYFPEFKPKEYFREAKPIHVTAPLGTNFVINGNEIRWQKFKMRIGFSPLEGVILHQISYSDENKTRPLIYRASISDTLSNYGDPRPNYNHRAAYDRNEVGLGFTINSLKENVDCVDTAHFFDVVVSNATGDAVTIKNAICVEENDAGILWRRVDWRTTKARSIRSTRLSVTFMITVANYDYVVHWHFYQDAKIQLELQLTGVVVTDFIHKDSPAFPHGTVVFPQVYAEFHQHFFMIRLDMDIDGTNNTVSIYDYVKGDKTGSVSNWYGQAIMSKKSTLRTVADGKTRTSLESSRNWRIQSSERKHPFTQDFTGYKLDPHYTPPLLIHDDSPMRKRAEFFSADVWVTPHTDDLLFGGGMYYNGGKGLVDFYTENGKDSVLHEDIVLWHNVGFTHIPRPEDFPVMQTVGGTFTLSPVSFFTNYEGLDVPSVSDNVKTQP